MVSTAWRYGSILDACGAELVVTFSGGNAVNGIGQIGFELDLEV